MRSLKFLVFFIVLQVYSVLSYAHVGSPGVSFQGKAGKYSIVANMETPDIVPANTDVSIFIENYNGEKVYVQTEYYKTGKKGSPMPELATAIKGAKGWFTYSAVIMSPGTVGINIIVEGSKGRGSVIVPIMAVPTAQRGMNLGLGIVLALLGVLMFVLMVTIISACASDGLVQPGSTPTNLKRKRNISMAFASAALIVIFLAGFKWGKREHNLYMRYMFRPIIANSTVFKYGAQDVLHMVVDSNTARQGNRPMSYIIPDHGKLMHLILVKEKTLDVFAHLHPMRKDSLNFLVNIPDLPAGRYFLYGDVVRWNGFSETILDTVDIPEKPVSKTSLPANFALKTSPDDAYLFTNSVVSNPGTNFYGKSISVCGNPGVDVKLDDGSTALLEGGLSTPFVAKKYSPLTFEITGADGKPAVLDPYMGMAGHAVVVKHDGSVYMHLHPIGNYAMASQELLNKRMSDSSSKLLTLPDAKKFRDSIDVLINKLDNMTEDKRNVYFYEEMGKTMDMSKGEHAKHGSTVIFPYSFPSAGKYRVWVQVKVKGKILTGAFDATVVDEKKK